MSLFSNKLTTIVICVILAVSTAVVFWQVHNFDFVNYDDNVYVYENQQVLKGLTYDGLISAFSSAPAFGNWLPLTWISFMLDCQLFGVNPGKMHLVNVLLHIANTLLLFAILKKMTSSLWPSAFVAAAFALHPMHAESVAWITERKDVLSTFFLLLTLAAYIGYAKRPSVYRYVATLVIFELGLLAKPMIVTLPFVLLLLDYWPLNRFAPKIAKTSPRENSKSWLPPENRSTLKWIMIEKIPFVALAVVSSVITFFVQRAGGSMIGVNALPLYYRITNTFVSYTRYIGKMLWPQNLTVFYPFDAASFTFWQVALSVLLLIIISVLVIGFGRNKKYLTVGWFWFVVTLVPVIGLIQVGEQAMADRYTYIPYIGLFIMIAWGLPELVIRWPHRKIILGTAMLIVLTAYGMRSFWQVSYWKNSITLFSHALEVTQNNYLAYDYIGQELYKQGKTALAIEQYKKALQIKPDSAQISNNLGVALDTRGNMDEANVHFRQAIRFRPDWPVPMSNLALLMATHPELKSRDVNEALRLAHRACELTNYSNPAFVGTLAAAYAAAGQFAKAIEFANKAIALADTLNQPQIKKVIQYHLSLYMQGKPYIEPAAKP